MQCVSVESHLFAWTLKHEAPESKHSEGRIRNVLSFVQPESSPAWKAMRDGGRLLHEESFDSVWGTLEFYVVKGRMLYSNIWRAALPMLGKMWLTVACPLNEWPLLLLRALDPDTIGKMSEDWQNAKSCCLGSSLQELHVAMPSARCVYTLEFQAIVKEFAEQLDFVTYDVEIAHRNTRQFLSNLGDKPAGVPRTSERHIASELTTIHRFAWEAQAKADDEVNAKLLAPKQLGEDKFMTGFKLFCMRTSPASCPTRQDVKSGRLAQAMSAQFKALPAADQEALNAEAAGLRGQAKIRESLETAAAGQGG